MFGKKLLHWNHHVNRRQMPWKGIKDPYKIWLSEIILQQTRVDQGLGYYERFIKCYPTIKKLASASDDEVFKLWEGLGYYNRCKNLLHTARFVSSNLNAIFPTKYDDIRALKGIGDYTAAAIASFAFNAPHAVVDGNVVRVISRVFGLDWKFHTASGKKAFQEKANELLVKDKPAIYNQAIMDFGATVCTPLAPTCKDCPFSDLCIAFNENRINELPLKKEKMKLKKRFFHFFIIEGQDSILIQKRTGKDIWDNLHQPYLIEDEKPDIIYSSELAFLKNATFVEKMEQKLSHQHIIGYFYRLKVKKISATAADLGLQMVKKSSLKKISFPRLILLFLTKNHYL